MTPQMQVGNLLLSFEEAEDTLKAIRAGMVDAVVVEGRNGDQVFTFRDPSHPYRLLVETMNEGAALLTSEGVVCYHNSRLAELGGWGKQSLCGRMLSDLAAEADMMTVDSLLAQARSAPARAEVNLVASDNSLVLVQLSLSLGFLAEVPVFCVVATDLRENKRQKLMYQSARLEIEARDRLFSVAAHELRGPLSVIQVQTHLLLTRLRDVAESSGAEIATIVGRVESVQKQGKHLAELISKLLDLGAIGSGRLQLAYEIVDLAKLVSRCVEAAADLLERSGSTVKLDLKSALGRWDRVRIEQVVSNLLSNAAKYGLGRPIQVSVQTRGRLAELRVEDQGPGIPLDQRERIFRPFERMETSKFVSGLGLGLYIAAEIVKAHRGSIRVEGEPGEGSRFVVELPID